MQIRLATVADLPQVERLRQEYADIGERVFGTWS